MNESQSAQSANAVDSDRKSRLMVHRPSHVQTLRERAASQPPRTGDPPISSSPLNRNFDRYNPIGGLSWTQTSRYTTMNRSGSLGMPQSVPTRSSSFSNDQSFNFGGGYNSFRSNVFASTFEDDESEIFSDDTGQYNLDSFQDFPRYRRPYSPDTNRSRSQSLAGLRSSQRRSLGFPIPEVSGIPQSWKETTPYLSETWRRPPVRSQATDYLSRSGRVIPQDRGSFSAVSPLRSTGLSQEVADISNISPFLRDVNQIFADEGNTTDQWGIGSAPGDEGWNPGSGTTSRRHSVSVVQPRRGTLGLSSSEFDPDERTFATRVPHSLRNGAGMDITQGLNALKLNTQDFVLPSESHSMPNSASQANTHFNQELEDRSGGRSLNLIPETASERSRYLEDLDMMVPRSPEAATSHFRNTQHENTPIDNLSGSFQQNALSELGKGIPLRSIPSSCPLYIVEFKAGRTDLFYSLDPGLSVSVGDLVIVEADRGRDLGKVINDTITAAEVEEWQQNTSQFSGDSSGNASESGASKQLNPKRIYSKATARDTQLLVAKGQDEEKALQLCQSKVQQKRLPMEVIDAEYQWDRRKLTFYFIAEKRIDFRELVRELFRLYKTRIWMASLSQAASAD